MKLEGTYTFNAPQDVVYKLLLDPAALRACMPGCERLEATSPDVFEATMKVGVASVKGTFIGKVELKDRQPPQAFTMLVDGSGLVGFMKGEGKVELVAQGGKTEVKWSGDAQVGGLIAGVGQRMIGGVSKMMIGQFFKMMDDQLGKGGAR
jgi:carbon monoxide dehydrogenase subunit G